MLKSLKLYLAGPMTGIPKFNFPVFDKAAAELRQRRYDVISPAEIDDPKTREAALASPNGSLDDLPPGESYGNLLSRDVKIVIDVVDAVAVLPGWEGSRGARIEVFTARQMGKPIYAVRPHADSFSTLLACTRPQDIDAALLFSTSKEGARRFPEASGKVLPKEENSISAQLGELESVADGLKGEIRTTSATGGEKGVKPERLDLIPPGALEELGRVYGAGAAKYSDNNYLKGYEYRKSMGAQLRHLMAFARGEDIDEETGCHHLMLAAWHSFTLYTYQTEGLGVDDRIFRAIEQSKRGEL